MKKRLLSILLALSMALTLCQGLAVPARAAEDLPDWYFLFAIIKTVDADCDDGSGVIRHSKYTMTQYEVDYAKEKVKEFEKYMNQIGVMRAHVDLVEFDGPVTGFSTGSYEGSSLGSFLDSKQAAPLLKANGVDLDKYDHVTCILSMNVDTTGYLGVTGAEFDNGTGISCINLRNRAYIQRWPASSDYLKIACVHEVLHFMERLCKMWGAHFDVHRICQKYYSGNYYVEDTYNKIILNQIKGDSETGTGVAPMAWRYTPRMLRSSSELTIPDGVTSIGYDAFDGYSHLESVILPNGMTSIGDYGFYNCSGLKSVTIPASVKSIGYAAFWGTNIKNVYYTGTQAQWKAINFGEFNAALTGASIHYNSVIPSTSTDPGPSAVTFTDVPDWCSAAVSWAVDKGVTNGVGNNKFDPDATCKNTEILTMLWRAEGKTPAKAASPFTVPSSYQAAVDWAYEKGLIDKSFVPGAYCTRADAMSYIWKALGSPSATVSSGFSDVSVWASYAKAVSWAAKNGVANGTGGGKFSPAGTCTRGHIVTFLHRAYVKDARLTVTGWVPAAAPLRAGA